MVNASLTVDQMRADLHTLPQELYDKIADLVFEYNGEARVITLVHGPVAAEDPRGITPIRYTKPPVQLQIDRNTRKKFIKEYYGSKIPWIFKCPNNWHHWTAWWNIQADAAKDVLGTVECDHTLLHAVTSEPVSGRLVIGAHLDVHFGFEPLNPNLASACEYRGFAVYSMKRASRYHSNS